MKKIIILLMPIIIVACGTQGELYLPKKSNDYKNINTNPMVKNESKM